MGLIIFILGAIGWHIGLYGMFKKAGIEPWKALVPFYNTWCIVQICGIKKHWFWLQLVPVAGQFITIWIIIIFVMHFGLVNFIQHTLLVFLPFAYMPYVGFSPKVRWGGKEMFNRYKKPPSREWLDAAAFAVVAATIIRTFVFEAYTIPSESMEKTLLINDFLFVNKMGYGARMPVTPISFPFVHNTLPGMPTTASYLKWIQVPYTRLPGYRKVERNDVVVFNVPVGDTIINLPNFGSKHLYYDILYDRDYQALMSQGGERFEGNRDKLREFYQDKLLVHPMDKTDNYIKRCVAVAGDVLEVRGGILYINDKPAFVPPNSQIDYNVPAGLFNSVEELNEKCGIEASDGDGFAPADSGCVVVNMNPEEKKKVEQQFNLKPLKIAQLNEHGLTFPFDVQNCDWTPDNFGPLAIPKKGETVTLTPKNISLYNRLISTYEHNTLEKNNGQYIINGKPTNQYTFKYNYYWMMGDNRHRSQDARFWGFVPETHIVGQASLIWMSYGSSGPRWSRFFKSIN